MSKDKTRHIVAYHGSIEKFDYIDLSKSIDIGFHIGSKKQALKRIKDKFGRVPVKNKYIYKVDIELSEDEIFDIEEDIFCVRYLYPDVRLAEIIANKFNIFKLNKKRYSLYNLRRFLLDKNIKLLKYYNDYEGDGFSYIVIDDTIKIKEINHG